MVDLGKYATEVLLAYGVTIVLMVALIIASVAKSRQVRKKLEQAEAKHANG